MIRFLTLSEVLRILEDQIRSYGGAYGVRDINLLGSAVSIPAACFDGQYLHATIPAMAAAYAFHICQNHPFIDGNKRAALASAFVFLDINGYAFNCKNEKLYSTMMRIAKGEIKKEVVVQFFEKHSVKT